MEVNLDWTKLTLKQESLAPNVFAMFILFMFGLLSLCVYYVRKKSVTCCMYPFYEDYFN